MPRLASFFDPMAGVKTVELYMQSLSQISLVTPQMVAPSRTSSQDKEMSSLLGEVFPDDWKISLLQETFFPGQEHSRALEEDDFPP